MKRKALLLSLSLCMLLTSCGSSSNEGSTPSGGTSNPPAQVAATPEAIPTPTPVPEPTVIPVDMELSNGHYTVGIDIPAGKYDIEAVSGGGNVISTNAFAGGINAILGTEEENQVMDIYEQKYSNIKLPNKVVLSISGVTVRLTCDEADGGALTPRDQAITESVELGNGNFVAGEDFPAGVYDIEAISGGGNISSSNILNGGINAILGTADQNAIIDMYEQLYQNIDLPADTTLAISGVTVRLTPSV